MPFDGTITKAISCELNTLAPCKIEKISQPDKNTIILGVYSNKKHHNINICLDSQNYRLSLTNHIKPVPSTALNFCMVLRKHLLGLKIQNFTTNSLERIVTICFEGFDDIDNIVSKKLVIELMGKHCNAILLDETNYIIDSLRHIPQSEDNNRSIFPKARYLLPSNNKENFLDITSSKEFLEIVTNKQEINSVEDISTVVSTTFTGLSNIFVKHHLNQLNTSGLNIINILEKLYESLNNSICNIDILKFEMAKLTTNKNKPDFCLVSSNNSSDLSLCHGIEDFYTKKESLICFTNKKNALYSKINELHKKYLTRLKNMNTKLLECDNMDIYRIYGELITSNLYQIDNTNMESIVLPNYYDNNNDITIPLDKKYIPSINAKRFFKKYSKLKNTLTIVSAQKNETLLEIQYIESLIYQLDTANSVYDLDILDSELLNTNILDIAKKIKIKEKNKKKQQNKKQPKDSTNQNVFTPLKYILGKYTLYVGRNNNENDYLTLKHAKKTDLWFHVKDFAGSHAVLSLNGLEYPNDELLKQCASISAYHSKCKNSSNVLVDYCFVKYVKKPSKSRPGMVIYTDNKTLCVDPKDNM